METTGDSGEAAEDDSSHRQIYGVTSRQHGVASLEQLVEVTSRSVIRVALHRGHLVAIDRRVMRVQGAPWTDRSRTMAALLWAGSGAMVSHSSGVALWGIAPFRIDPLHLTIARGIGRGHNPAPSSLATIHRQRSLSAIPPSIIDGIPVVRPEVAVLQLCGTLHPARAERLLDAFWRERLLSGSSLKALLDRIETRGVEGVALLRRLLDERPGDYVPPASGLEARVAAILREANLPEMARQRDLGDEARWCGRVDFADRNLSIVLEVDSEKYHSALVDVEHDAERQARLEAAGFVVARVTDLQVWHRPREVVDVVRQLRQAGKRRR